MRVVAADMRRTISSCKRSASIPLPRRCHCVPPKCNGRGPILARNLHFCGMRRHACTQARRLITRRSQVQILPPLLRKAPETGISAFRALDGARHPSLRAAAITAIDLSQMAACPACRRDNPEGFLFCGFCGARLSDRAGAVASERKVVTVLFCDLVGFTASSEDSDPEKVQARLDPFRRKVRDRIEAFGGTLEKFVGDGVMAVFGAPFRTRTIPSERSEPAWRSWRRSTS